MTSKSHVQNNDNIPVQGKTLSSTQGKQKAVKTKTKCKNYRNQDNNKHELVWLKYLQLLWAKASVVSLNFCRNAFINCVLQTCTETCISFDWNELSQADNASSVFGHSKVTDRIHIGGGYSAFFTVRNSLLGGDNHCCLDISSWEQKCRNGLWPTGTLSLAKKRKFSHFFRTLIRCNCKKTRPFSINNRSFQTVQHHPFLSLDFTKVEPAHNKRTGQTRSSCGWMQDRLETWKHWNLKTLRTNHC